MAKITIPFEPIESRLSRNVIETVENICDNYEVDAPDEFTLALALACAEIAQGAIPQKDQGRIEMWQKTIERIKNQLKRY